MSLESVISLRLVMGLHLKAQQRLTIELPAMIWQRLMMGQNQKTRFRCFGAQGRGCWRRHVGV